MARNDITIYDTGAFGYPGDVEYTVPAGTATSIKAGEPVGKALGSSVVLILGTSKPVVATDFMAGIAASDSTDTASATGTVKVTKLVPGMSFLIAPKTAATWDTQAEYDALVGARVTLDLTSSTWTINATDGATNGCVILPLEIKKFPGKVRFAFRNGVNYLA